MRYTRHITSLLLVAALFAGCRKDDRTPVVTDGRILFSADILDVNVGTRASVVTSSSLDASGIYVSATRGSAGSETSLWTSTAFTKTGSYFDGGRYWDESNPGYHFYSANTPLTFSAAGTTVSASNTTDVVCEYLVSPTFKGVNTLSFDHIFARIGNVTVSAADGYTITNVHMSITPYTGGTYNLRTGSGQSDGTGWSALVSGSATELANTTPSTKSNDLYLVPGTYDIAVTWTATKGAYTIDAEKTFSDVAVEGGKVNAVTVSLKGDASSVELGVTVTPWTGNAVAMGDVTPEETVYSFGGLEIAPGNTYWDASEGAFKIASDWTQQSYGSAKLYEDGSFYFWPTDLFPLASEPLVDDWCIPSYDNYREIILGSRTGSTVNGSSNVLFSFIQIYDYIIDVSGDPVYGLLLFPDDQVINGAALWYYNEFYDSTIISTDELNNYISQGCAVLPCYGYMYKEKSTFNWQEVNWTGLYYCVDFDLDVSDAILFSEYDVIIGDYMDCNISYMNLRLVRPIE